MHKSILDALKLTESIYLVNDRLFKALNNLPESPAKNRLIERLKTFAIEEKKTVTIQ